MAILVIAEHDHLKLGEVTFNAIGAGKQIGEDIHLLIVGSHCDLVVEQATHLTGISTVLVADADIYADVLAENIANLLANIAKDYTHVVAAATAFSKNFLPRAAALLDVSFISEVIDIESHDTFCKPIYSGSAIATIQSADPIKMMTIRSTAFSAFSETGGSAAVVPVPVIEDMRLSQVISHRTVESSRPELSSARIVIGGGRGLGNETNFTLLETLGDKLGAAIGGTRAAVDAGFTGNDLQIGQTGKVIAPDLYIAVGISGAIQHTSGVKDAKTIVAINHDADAPIFKSSDYVLVADCMDVLPELIEKL
ncbi:electron transfer flavoprotein subunit alpha/FixB family protein [Vibrio mangrovi]|uniref:Electron transfer flavoprotein subunit alpha n=1 Tax=Vibrio mangrovi TaxID=474394 RepID=A0A1Y6IXL0_9VIBR|nr:FAD-binding protein [Vibrio mangrovi]MDW6004475.1 FAD-binding protein [Vibrio mangrovi]SMS00763.1 Electron transfer flavoprotein subunit alpha [Vibrio mangrovi]